MKLYNTRTKSIEEFKTLDGSDIVRIYSCGPTVYNHAHIGNLSAYIFADMLRRTLKLSGYSTNHVMNFTDVDDKTIRDSRIKYPDLSPEESLIKLTRYYEEIFINEMVLVGNDIKSFKFVRATESIYDMQDLIKNLINQKIAYISDDGIYFSIKEYQKNRVYGQLSNIETDSESQSRIDNDEYDKDSAKDFTLWKRHRSGEPSWPFEIDGVNFSGRPGWHIECSAMSAKQLGQPFDIHTGGIDLIFPHHENEIAQSTAGNQPQLYSNFFLHNEHLLVDGAKMSKSKNNFYSIVDLTNKGYQPLDFRMLILQSHYQSPSNFSWDNLTAAQNRLKNWRNRSELRWQSADSNNPDQLEIIDSLIKSASNALKDNLRTPDALRFIDEAFNQINTDNVNHTALSLIMKFIDNALGLKIQDSTPDIGNEQKDLIAQRNLARDNRDFSESDRIRNILNDSNIHLSDIGKNSIWYRK